MNAAKKILCVDDPFNPLVTTTLQASGILVISHFFHLILKPLGQPGPVAQILAGLVLGPSILSRISFIGEIFIQSSSADYYEVISSLFCVLFMFLIGLQTDIPYLRRNLRKATILAYGGLITCSIFGLAASVFIIHVLKLTAHPYAVAFLIVIVLSNAASPAVIRLAAELKFSTSDTGRLAVCTALINEMSCVFWFSAFFAFKSWKMFGRGMLFFSMTIAVIILNKYLASWCDQRNRNQKYVTTTEMYIILILIVAVAFLIEEYGFNSSITSFFIGLMFPREGKTARTLGTKLAYAVHNFILPMYFGYIGFQFNTKYFNSCRNVITIVLMIILSMGGKIFGTLIACRYLKVPVIDGIMISFFLNLKGHAELLLVGMLSKTTLSSWWDENIHNLVIIIVVLNTVISGPAVAYTLKRNENYFAQKYSSVEFRQPEAELRILTCVYGSRHITAKVGLIFALSGSLATPTTAYLMHLVELPKRNRKNLMYHQLQDGGQYSDEEDYGGNDVVEINETVDAITMENKFSIHQSKVVSSFPGMYADVCDAIEDLRVSIVLLTFHKHQRLDGKLENGKEGMRLTNQKILRHAPCSVGIFVDREQTGFQLPTSDTVQNVATLFFGGLDDREALSCSRRIAAHPHTNFTLIHFAPSSPIEEQVGFICKTSRTNSEVLMEMSNHDREAETDKKTLEDFCNRYVASGQAGYEVKYVDNGRQTVEALRELGQRFSLLIVGKGGRRSSSITTGLSDWEECPELGTVGDILASSEFNFNCSVLVIQQHQPSETNIRSDD